MSSSDPSSIHRLDQYLAFSLEVQCRLYGYKETLKAEGWSEAEAWALTQKVEERLLGKILDQIDLDSPL